MLVTIMKSGSMDGTGYKILWSKIQHNPLWFWSGILEASVQRRR